MTREFVPVVKNDVVGASAFVPVIFGEDGVVASGSVTEDNVTVADDEPVFGNESVEGNGDVFFHS